MGGEGGSDFPPPPLEGGKEWTGVGKGKGGGGGYREKEIRRKGKEERRNGRRLVEEGPRLGY